MVKIFSILLWMPPVIIWIGTFFDNSVYFVFEMIMFIVLAILNLLYASVLIPVINVVIVELVQILNSNNECIINETVNITSISMNNQNIIRNLKKMKYVRIQLK